jgi:O-antigen/teichoic acid export membrane protein
VVDLSASTDNVRVRRVTTLFTYGSLLGTSLLGLANMILVARELGPSGRGDVAFFTAVSVISAYFLSLSIQEANANLASRGTVVQSFLASNSVGLAAVLGLVAISVAVGCVAYVPVLSRDVSALTFTVALASIPAMMLQVYFAYLARGSYYFTVANVALLSAPLLTLGLNVTLIAAGKLSVATAVSAWTAGNIASALILAVHHHLRTGYGRVNLPLAGESVRFGLQAHAGGVFAMGSYSLDLWILGATAPPADLGVYSVAVAWFQGLFLLPMAVSVVARPDIVRLDPARAADHVARLVRVTLLLTSISAGAICLLAPVLCTWVFGAAFEDAVGLLRILAPGAIGVCLVKILGAGLIARWRPLLESAAMGVGFSVALVLYLLLIPRFGGEGAAIASTIAYSCAGLAALVLACRAFSLRVMDLVPRSSDLRLGSRPVHTR